MQIINILSAKTLSMLYKEFMTRKLVRYAEIEENI